VLACTQATVLTRFIRGSYTPSLWKDATGQNRLLESAGRDGCRLCQEGRSRYVEGRLQYGTYQGEEGKARGVAEIEVDDVQLLSRRTNGQRGEFGVSCSPSPCRYPNTSTSRGRRATMTCSEMLGHSSIIATLDTYAHVIHAMHGEAATAMDAVLTA
jgi:hypothetical protein